MITQQEYQLRRTTLMQRLKPDSVVLVSASNLVTRNNDCHYRFRQRSDFFYLSGFEEPNALLVLIPGAVDQYHLFLRPSSELEELWDGKRAGLEGAKKIFQVDESYSIASCDEILPFLLEDKTQVYYLVGEDTLLDNKLSTWLNVVKAKARSGVKAPSEIIDLQSILSEMRLIKSEAEIELMRHAAKISAKAHKHLMQNVRGKTHEYQLEAELLYGFHYGGCRAPAYDSIVASGANGCVLHYTSNNAPLDKEALVLVDAGGEYYNYAADITRTFPVSGKFSKEQKEIYELVLKAQLAGIEKIKPGIPWPSIQEVMVGVITEGLLALGLIKGSVESCIEEKTYQRFYMHNSGHWLGLDVHDEGSYKHNGQWRPLKKNMLLTVEPGIYIAAHHLDVDSRWHNIAVRIEDDVLVTESGYEILSSDAPKEVAEIEALVRGD